MKTREEYMNKLKEIPFFQEGKHPEYLPFVGEEYPKYQILQVAESHYIPNFLEDTVKKGKKYIKNAISYKDFVGWWDGDVPESVLQYASGWYTTGNILKWYMEDDRHKCHSVFGNPLKSFLNVVVPEETFQNITANHSKKYEYFAFMNFWQMPSLYYGKNYSKALYESMKVFSNDGTTKLLSEYDDLWYKCFEESARVFEQVIEALEPRAILITSSEVGNSYKTYGTRVATKEESKYEDRNGYYFAPGKLAGDSRIIYLDHPGCSWWNRRKKGKTESSKEKMERRLKEIYR